MNFIIQRVKEDDFCRIIAEMFIFYQNNKCFIRNSDNPHTGFLKNRVKIIKENQSFRKGIVNIFFEGSTIPFLAKTIPLFELKKLSIAKLKFEIPEMIDTLVRYKEKGSYSAKKENNPEILIEKILKDLNIPFEKGDLSELVTHAPITKRTMDFIIPDKRNPLIIAESSFLVTTSSGQGDKSKTEISVDNLIKSHYPKAKFIGFIDGVGWYVRKGDLKRMVSAYKSSTSNHLKSYEVFPLDFAKVFLFGRNSYPYYRSSFSTACHRWDPSFPVRLPTRPRYYSRCLLKIEYWCHPAKTIKAQSLRF